jgi:hypothetical protein
MTNFARRNGRERGMAPLTPLDIPTVGVGFLSRVFVGVVELGVSYSPLQSF